MDHKVVNETYAEHFLKDVPGQVLDTSAFAVGIDVSSEQGVFNWAAYKNKLSFAMVRATSWTGAKTFGMDSQFEANWDGMWEVNGPGKLVRFAYHYARPGMTNPVQQATGLVEQVMSCGLALGDHFVLDLEENDGEPPAYVTQWAADFCHTVNMWAPSHRCLIYASPNFANTSMDLTHDIQRWYLWVANYQVKAPAVPFQWAATGWKFWQWDDNPIDKNFYNGSEADLLKFARMPENRV